MSQIPPGVAADLQAIYARFPSTRVIADATRLEAAAREVLTDDRTTALLEVLNVNKDVFLDARREALSRLLPLRGKAASKRTAVVSGLSNGGLVAAAMLAVIFARVWQPTQEPEDSGSELLRRELLARGASLVRAGRQEEAISAYNELIDRFATRREPEVALLVAQAMLAKGSAYGQRKRWDVALVAFGTLIARYGQAESQELLVQVAKAMLAKGAALVQLDQLELASGVLRDVVSKFGGTGDAAAQEVVSEAENLLVALSVTASQAA